MSLGLNFLGPPFDLRGGGSVQAFEQVWYSFKDTLGAGTTENLFGFPRFLNIGQFTNQVNQLTWMLSWTSPSTGNVNSMTVKATVQVNNAELRHAISDKIIDTTPVDLRISVEPVFFSSSFDGGPTRPLVGLEIRNFTGFPLDLSCIQTGSYNGF